MKIKTIAFTYILFISIILPFTAYAQDLDDIDNAIQKEESNLIKLQRDKKSAVKQLQSVSDQIENYKRLMDTLNTNIANNTAKISQLETNINDLNKSIKKSKKDITHSNKFFIDNSGYSQLTVVATSKIPSETVKTLEILSKASQNLAQNVQNESIKLTELKKLAAEKKIALDKAKELNQKRTQAVAKLQKENTKYKNMLVLIKNDVAGRKEYVEMLKFQRQSLDDELKKASSLVIRNDENLSAKSNFKKSHLAKGKLVWPVEGIVIESFGESYMEDAGVTFFHKGIKIRPFKSTPVFASADGTVIFADYLKGFDNIIIVDHGKAFYTVYGNLNELRVAAGKKISRGDILGRINVDLSNNTSYLYFEIRKNDDALNPADWLAGYKKKVNK